MDGKVDIIQPLKGLNLDSNPMNLDASEVYTHALNVRQESEDGNATNLSNESSNFCYTSFPRNVIGRLNIVEENKVIIFSVGDNYSEIGYILTTDIPEDVIDEITTDECTGKLSWNRDAIHSDKCASTYTTIVKSKCLGFSRDYPIHSADYKITNKTVEIYWTDDYNHMRWLDLYNIPVDNVGDLDCNLLKIFPDYQVPVLETVEELDNGSLKAGSYQFFVAYANKKGKVLSQYFSVTNPNPIFESVKSDVFDFVTSKSIKLKISKISREFRYINLAVCKIINGVKSYFLVGTYDIVSDIFEYVYTGNDKIEQELSSQEILFRQSYYDRAGTVVAQNRQLMFGNLTAAKRINYQEIASKIHLMWEDWRIPYNKFEGYYNSINTANYRGYMRDELYAFEIVFILKSGQITDRFPIPGRIATGYDLESITNQDAINFRKNPCEPTKPMLRWQVYNTASVTGIDSGFKQDDDCYIGPYRYGEFGYWESTDTYPNDPVIWGDLAGKKIRHHKFPDSLVTHIHDASNDLNHVHSIYPIGVRVDEKSLIDAINKSSLDQVDKDNIVGYQIVRADRGDNASIRAKGLLFNVGKYSKDGNDYYFPNYNYNDLGKDPFLSKSKPLDHSGSNDGNAKVLSKTTVIDNSNAANNFTTTISSYALFVENYSYNIVIPYTSPVGSGTITFGLYLVLNTKGEVEPIFDVTDVNYTTLTYGSVPLNTGYMFITLPVNTNGNPNADKYITLCVYVDTNGVHGTITGSGSKLFRVSLDIMGTVLKTESTVAAITGNSTYLMRFDAYSYSNTVSSDIRLDAFVDRSISGRRFTFMSPQTSPGFSKPSLSGVLKLETVEFGKTISHITNVQSNPKYTIGTEGGIRIAAALAFSTVLSMEIDGGTSGFTAKPNVQIGNFLPGFASALDLIKKLIPFRQYGYQYTSVGKYSNFKTLPNDGNKIRSIDLIGYLDPGLLSIGDDSPINNYQRESSVYIRTISELPYPHDIQGVPEDNSRFTLSSYLTDTGIELDIDTKVNRDISSFYASIKVAKPDQYGQIQSYQPILTGGPIYLDRLVPKNTSIFGGDTFINRFADKRKLPFFLTNTVGEKDDTDVLYHELHNVAYPTYWMSTSPVETEMGAARVEEAGDIVAHADTNAGTVIGNMFSGGIHGILEAMRFVFHMAGDIIKRLGNFNTNLDKYSDKGYFEEGKFYLFTYGIPFFFVESEINVDYRQAGTSMDKDFFPNVGTDIPDFWLQEKNVSIQKDNSHLYNRDYSRLNKENVFTSLPVDYDPKRNIDYHTTRVIYSEPYTLEDNQNNWLVYRANSAYDFPLVNGKLIDLNALEEEKVLARFENNTAIYNAFISLKSDNKNLIAGTGDMFSTPPQEFTKSSIGYAGTQHKAFVSTKYGHFWIDAKRGEVFQFQSSIDEISKYGMRNWFKENLPFHVSKYYDINVDNSFKDVGLSICWDNRFERVFITKKDYIPRNSSIKYVNNQFELNSKVIQLTDEQYFCNASWTVAYSPRTKTWVSFYSFLPNYYISSGDNFFSGLNNKLWIHSHSNKSFQTFYGKVYPFEIECITKPDIKSNILNSINYRMDTLRYTNQYDWKYINDSTFNQACIYSTQQTSGDLDLNIPDKLDMSFMDGEIKTNSISISVIKADDIWRFNKFSDVTLDHTSMDPLFNLNCANNLKSINRASVDYTKTTDMLRRTRLRSDWFKVKLQSTRDTRFKKIFKWLISNQTKSTR